MKSDRELLELAARAHGFVDDAVDNSAAFGLHRDDAGRQYYWIDGNGWVPWVPYMDDGQALRLAVKLGVIIGTYAHFSTVDLLAPNERIETVTVWHHETAGDSYAAARLAIVHAAAEIGEKLGIAASGTAPSADPESP